MVAVLLIGLVAFQFLPVSALPEVDYPTIQVSTFYPGASPEVMTTAVTAPLEREFGEMPGLAQMSSISSAGASGYHAAVRAGSVARRGRAGGAGRGQCGDRAVAVGPAGAAGLRQDQSRGHAGDLACRHLRDYAADDGRGSGRRADRPEAVAAVRRGPGVARRRPAAGGAHPDQSARAGRPTAWRSTTSAPTSPTRTPTCRKATSTDRRRTPRSTTTTSWKPPTSTGI